MQEKGVKSLLDPQVATGAGVTGSYVDTQDYFGHGHREVKFVLQTGVGTTVGTAGGSIQSADDTSGTNLATVTTFATASTLGGTQEKHAVIPAGQRYIRFLGSVQTGKDMVLGALMVANKRDTEIP